jgi:hypothetical protein
VPSACFFGHPAEEYRSVTTPPGVATLVRRAESILVLAERGLADLQHPDATRRIPGLANVATYGRAVTQALHRLRGSIGTEYDEWWDPIAPEFEEDELMVFFNDLRNAILKRGELPAVKPSMYVESLHGSEITALMSNPPPGAKGFVMSDSLGGSGWEIELPDGSTQMYYVALPESLRVEISLHLPDPPATHRGQPLTDTSVEALATLYVNRLRDLIRDARRQFGLPF